MAGDPVADEVLDARGLACPLPVIRAKRALGGLPVGAVLEVRATDPGSREDFAAWCRATGHELVATRTEGDVYRFWLRRAI